MLQIAPGFSKDKTKRLDNLKNFWKRNKTKAFGPKILRTDRKHFVSIQNFDLKTFTFDLLWNESSKTEASDLERSLIWHCYTRYSVKSINPFSDFFLCANESIQQSINYPANEKNQEELIFIYIYPDTHTWQFTNVRNSMYTQVGGQTDGQD